MCLTCTADEGRENALATGGLDLIVFPGMGFTKVSVVNGMGFKVAGCLYVPTPALLILFCSDSVPIPTLYVGILLGCTGGNRKVAG